MDPLSHAALGRSLVALTPTARGRAFALAATLGALSPDIDAVLMPLGWDIYLRVHEIGTHSLVGTSACAVATGSIVHAVAGVGAWRRLVACAWLGAVSHVLLDVISSARIRVFWPIDDRQVSVPLVAMADPWLAAILIAGTAFLLRTSARGRRVAGVVLALATAFLLLKAALAGRAFSSYQAAANGDPAGPRIVEARWAALFEWYIFDRAGGMLRAWRSHALSNRPELVLTWPETPETARVAASRTLPAVRNFLRVHGLVLATVVPQPDGREWILWSDIRYCRAPATDRLEPVAANRGVRLSCALWFGGEFDQAGRPRRQIVRVLGFMQTRAVDE